MHPVKTLIVVLLATVVLSACQKEEEESLVNKGSPEIDLPTIPDVDSPTSPSTPQAPSQPTTPVNSFTVSISWDIPRERVNGEELLLSEIGGYEIAYKRTVDESYSIVIVDNQNSQTQELTGLPAGHYEFLIAAFDSLGIYSDYSDPTFADIGN
ncbi:fibronectin type III domain-containing protein [Saccharophagus degradans]|uniref:Fibronectin, type III n=1 Tax=Saccharophagus degradans (strain 2-40 / ATCC 43961 / DSM 17024) TaxID=203122 RepID=Q21ET1_SACD2|nr:fibronectin type III domain-containing protein [Saccharophagus degradans]ABD82798.1 Fibronectin, type III [Saccharophagus degradans 2-40]